MCALRCVVWAGGGWMEMVSIYSRVSASGSIPQSRAKWKFLRAEQNGHGPTFQTPTISVVHAIEMWKSEHKFRILINCHSNNGGHKQVTKSTEKEPNERSCLLAKSKILCKQEKSSNNMKGCVCCVYAQRLEEAVSMIRVQRAKSTSKLWSKLLLSDNVTTRHSKPLLQWDVCSLLLLLNSLPLDFLPLRPGSR